MTSEHDLHSRITKQLYEAPASQDGPLAHLAHGVAVQRAQRRADSVMGVLEAHTRELREEIRKLQADLEAATSVQVWPLARVLADVRCGSQDWTWDEEWADLDQRHAATGYLDTLDQQIQANGITMPVLIGNDGRLWDGHHRLRIAVRQGIPYVPVEIVPGRAEEDTAPTGARETTEEP